MTFETCVKTAVVGMYTLPLLTMAPLFEPHYGHKTLTNMMYW